MIDLSSLAGAADTFFFEPTPVATVVVFRILVAILLLINGVLLARDSATWFGPNGVLPLDMYLDGPGADRLMIFRVLPDSDTTARAVLSLHLVSAVAIALGMWTSIAAAVAFVTLTSLHQRNPLIVHSGDCVLKLMCLLLVFSQAGAALSVTGGSEEGVRALASPWAARLMQIQISIVYFRAFSGKLRGETWRNGTAAYYANALREHRRMLFPRIVRGGAGLRFVTWTALAIEAGLATLIWIDEFRYPVLLAGIALHLGIELFMNVQLFGWTMMASLVLFVPANDMARFLEAIG